MISVRHVRSVILALAICLSLDLWIDAQVRMFCGALLLSSDRLVTQAQDEASAQESVHSDPEREAERAVLPVHDKGKRHVLYLLTPRARHAAAACLTRAPPSA